MTQQNIISHREFEVLFKDDDFMLEVIKQLLKDFRLSGIDASEININVSTNQLVMRLSNLIDHILNLESAKLQTLMYQVDIPESLIAEEQLAEEEANVSDVIAQLLIKRVMLKVVTRMRYS